ncbi:MAG: hypothetical protein MJZ18_03620 [Bacteroidales bacterium]|nr:hypothetical protein [Bacteroidales bacterium]
MAKATIRRKCITIARSEVRANSTARVDGRSVFIKRYPGHNFRIIMVHVSKKQRVLAKEDMLKWNRVRHWERYARQHKKHGAYRAAVSYYYKMIREHSDELREIGRNVNGGKIERIRMVDSKVVDEAKDLRIFSDDNIFFWVKFDSVSDYREALNLAAG